MSFRTERSALTENLLRTKDSFRTCRAKPTLTLGLLLTVTVFAGFNGRPAAAERWTSLSGSHTVEADFIGLWGDQVVLELPDQRRVSVSLNDLIAESRIQARRMAEQNQQRRVEMKEQILADAQEAAAPAPTPLPEPPEAAPYQPLSPGGTLLNQLEWADQQARNGHVLLASVDAIPASMQGQIETAIQRSINRIDANTVDAVASSIHSIGELIVTRQRWLFSHPRLNALDPGVKENLKNILLGLGGAIREGLNPQQFKPSELASTPLRSWAVELDQRVAPHLAQVFSQLELMGVPQPTYEVMQERDGKTIVQKSFGGGKLTQSYVNVEGVWVPEEMTGESFAQALKAWEEGPAQPQTGAMLVGGMMSAIPTLLDTYTQPALAANSAREFHSAMDGVLNASAPLMASLANFNPLARRGGGGGYDDGYEGDMDMEMDMEMEMEMEMDMESDMEMEMDMEMESDL